MIIDAQQAFGILADGSDETAKINQAIAAATGPNADLVYFGPGVYGCNGLATITDVCSFFGAGPRKTIFKNLSANTRLFEFAGSGGTPGNFATAFSKVGGFTVDQNGCTADAFRLNIMYSRLYDIWIKDQAGAGWAVNAKNCTLSKLMDDVHITNSSNGVLLDTCYYPRLTNVSIERQTGTALRAVNCAAVSLRDLYLDHGNPSSVGQNVGELMVFDNCTTVCISDLTMEMAAAANLTPNRYMLIKNSKVSVNGGRVNHYATGESSSYMFYAENSTLALRDIEWFEAVPGMIFVGGSSGSRIMCDNIDTYVTTTGSRYAIGTGPDWGGTPSSVIIRNWHDRANQTDAFINSPRKEASHCTFRVMQFAG